MSKHRSKHGKHGKHGKQPIELLPMDSRLIGSMSSIPSIDLIDFDLDEDPELTSDFGALSPPPTESEGYWNTAVTSNFLSLYYRNERFNLQCFPGCQEYGDYATWKREGKKHKKRTGCTFAVSAIIRTPYAGFAYGDILALGHITRIDDNPHAYFSVGETYDYAHVQSLMEPPPPPVDTSNTAGGSKPKPSGGQPALIRGMNPEMEKKGGDVQLLGDKPLPMQFFPPEDRWFQQQSLTRTKKIKGKQPTDDKFVFEMLVFHLPVSNDVNSKLEYHLVGKQCSDLFEISSTRTLKRELKANSETTDGVKKDHAKKEHVKKERVKRKQGDDDGDKRKKIRENPKHHYDIDDEPNVNSDSDTDSDSDSDTDADKNDGEEYSIHDNSSGNMSDSSGSSDDTDYTDDWVGGVAVDIKRGTVATGSDGGRVPSKRPDATREESDSQLASSSRLTISGVRVPIFRPKASHKMLATKEDLAGVRSFLEAHNLAVYEKPLVSNGYDSITRLFVVQLDDLMALGFKRGHAQHLLSVIEDDKRAERHARRKEKRQAKQRLAGETGRRDNIIVEAREWTRPGLVHSTPVTAPSAPPAPRTRPNLVFDGGDYEDVKTHNQRPNLAVEIDVPKVLPSKDESSGSAANDNVGDAGGGGCLGALSAVFSCMWPCSKAGDQQQQSRTGGEATDSPSRLSVDELKVEKTEYSSRMPNL